MPSFCRHNRLIQNCSICAREQSIEPRPIVSRPGSTSGRPRSAERGTAQAKPERTAATRVRVRRLERGTDDGYSSALVPGLKSSEEAARLAGELAFAQRRLAIFQSDPPGLLAVVADPRDELEERTWLAFQIAYLGPLDAEHPFAAIEAVRTSWASGALPKLNGVQTGPRAAHDAGRGVATLEAYRAWAARAGSQALAFGGEASWTPERRFARVFERLALPGMHRDARFDLLATLGELGLYELRPGSLELGGVDEVTVAAKRVFGIGDPLLLERRAADLAAAAGSPLQALDLALYNWGAGERHGVGVSPALEPDPGRLTAIRSALELSSAG
jgi:hypothetical protein